MAVLLASTCAVYGTPERRPSTEESPTYRANPYGASKLAVSYGPAAAEPRELVADSSRIRQELGWTSPRSDLATIVRDAWEAP